MEAAATPSLRNYPRQDSERCSRQPGTVRFLSIKRLSEFKRVALRRRVWFLVLSRVERGVLDLTMRYVDGIKSAKLAKVVTAILSKLQATLETFADRMVRTIGCSLAEKMSAIAVGWGNKSAQSWRLDRGYARYLAVCFSFRTSGV